MLLHKITSCEQHTHKNIKACTKMCYLERYLHVTVLLGDDWMKTETPFDMMLVIVQKCS